MGRRGRVGGGLRRRPWGLLAAIAARTERVRLGTILTPAPWRRPWKLASQVATVDQLSGGRAFVTLGLGALSDDLPQTGEITDRRERAERLDETIDVMQALWAGEREYHGEVYDVTCPDWLLDAARPVQAADPDLGGRGVAPAEVDATRCALRRGRARVRRAPPGRPRGHT